MKIFIIHPVRNAPRKLLDRVYTWTMGLESRGHKVYLPIRDTNQNDPIGLRICKDNRQAILDADEVHVFWDGKSKGCLFDLGMTFAFHKKILIQHLPKKHDGKSFQAMVEEWEKQQ